VSVRLGLCTLIRPGRKGFAGKNALAYFTAAITTNKKQKVLYHCHLEANFLFQDFHLHFFFVYRRIERERERKSVCVCVCEREREREKRGFANKEKKKKCVCVNVGWFVQE